MNHRSAPMTAASSPTAAPTLPPPTAPSTRWAQISLFLLAILISLTIAALKFSALHAWRYTSDLFVIDTMFQETLRGHFMMEYTYGCQFGDHACLIFLLGVPLKFLLRKYMVYLLLLVSPLALVTSAAVIYKAARALAGPHWASFATLLYLLSLGVIRGPFETTFGFHIDTIAGYVACTLAALLMTPASNSRRRTLQILLLTLIFVSLKEEIALLSILFFTLLLVFRRTRLHLTGLAISIIAFITEISLTRLFRTPWNRTNERLLIHLVTYLRRDGLSFFLSKEKTGYWIAVAALVVIMLALMLLTRRVSLYPACLFAIGLAKLTFAWSVNDFDLFAWHNYPAIVMLNGGIILQSLELRHLDLLGKSHLIRPTAAILCTIAALWFLIGEIPFALVQAHKTQLERTKIASFIPAMRDLQKHVDKSHVVSIPRYSAAEWTNGYRYSFFPHGISQNPMGIADYLVLPRNKQKKMVPELKVFSQIYQNGKYRLFARKTYLPGEQTSRENFIHRFGPTSLGPKPKSTKSHKHKPTP